MASSEKKPTRRPLADTPKTVIDFAVRGILIGGAIGAFAGLMGLDMRRAVFLGMATGALAGITLFNRRFRK